MAEHERDERVSAAYRGLGREEPPAGLDAAILAAARRPRRRWAVPVSIAAVVVLAVGVTLRVQLERPEESQPVAMAPRVLEAPATPPVAMSEAKKEARAADARSGKPAPSTPAPQVAAPAPAPDAAAVQRLRQAPAGASIAIGVRGTDAEVGVSAERSMARDDLLIGSSPETPEQWLERIARLRAEGKDHAADESLAEFKRRYPDYEIPEKMRARIERR